MKCNYHFLSVSGYIISQTHMYRSLVATASSSWPESGAVPHTPSQSSLLEWKQICSKWDENRPVTETLSDKSNCFFLIGGLTCWTIPWIALESFLNWHQGPAHKTPALYPHLASGWTEVRSTGEEIGVTITTTEHDCQEVTCICTTGHKELNLTSFWTLSPISECSDGIRLTERELKMEILSHGSFWRYCKGNREKFVHFSIILPYKGQNSALDAFSLSKRSSVHTSVYRWISIQQRWWTQPCPG